MTRERIQYSVNSILQAHPDGIDFAEFQKLLATKGIDVQPYAPGGQLKGVSYFCDNFKWPGSKIGRAYSAGLRERGVKYDAQGEGEKDIPTPARLVAKSARNDQIQRYAPAHALHPGPHRRATVLSPMDMQRFTKQVGDLNIGPLSKSMLVLGGAAIHLSIEALLALIRFVQALLARLGIKLRYSSQDDRVGEPYFVEPRSVRWDPVAKDLAPAFLPSELPTQAGIDDAAEKILTTATAIKSGNPDLLPEVGDDAARVALVRSLTPDGSAAGALAAAAPALDEIPVARAAVISATVAAVAPAEAIARLQSASEAWVINRRHLITARTQPASAEAAQRTALEASFGPSTAAYHTAQAEARDVFTRLIDSVEDPALTKKLKANLKSALSLMQMIEQPASMYQDLPALISSGVKQLAGLKAALETAEAQRRQQQGADQVDEDDGLHDAPKE